MKLDTPTQRKGVKHKTIWCKTVGLMKTNIEKNKIWNILISLRVVQIAPN